MKTCKKCFREFEESEVDVVDVNDLCPQCREELGVMEICRDLGYRIGKIATSPACGGLLAMTRK